MPTPILATKLAIPPLRPRTVGRGRLLGRIDEGIGQGRSLTLVSAPAGFGKTTLLAEWARSCGRPVAWLSLAAGEGRPGQFLLYLAAAIHAAIPDCGADAMASLQSPRPAPTDLILGGLINELDGISGNLIVVLDDYHAVDSADADHALGFLLDNIPPRLHLAIATREDPVLPLARLRARNLMTEIRAADLRFGAEEASDFLTRTMGLELTPPDRAVLEERAEGWIAGLQMAALSLEGQDDIPARIRAFSSSHRFALDYLAEEVLMRQPAGIRDFLLRTSILDRLCGPLCDALLPDPEEGWPEDGLTGSDILDRLDQANLFLSPLDGGRYWYRYHGLFRELLLQRLGGADREGRLGQDGLSGLHAKASIWFEAAGHYLDAFRHAVSAGDLDRAEGLAGHREMPRHSPLAIGLILDWIHSCPPAHLDARPSLRVMGATLSLTAGRTQGVEEGLAAAESALRARRADPASPGLLGRIAAARATLALTRYRPDLIMTEAQRALDLLPPEDLAFRFTAKWTLAFAHSLLGDREASAQGFAEALTLSQAAGDAFSSQLVLCSLGEAQLLDSRLHEAAATYSRALLLFGDHPLPDACEAQLGIARIQYEWNDLEAAGLAAEQGLFLARQYEASIDRFVPAELLLARIALANGRLPSALARLEALAATAKARGFLHRIPEINALRATALLSKGEVQEAAALETPGEPDPCRARILVAAGRANEALAFLDSCLSGLTKPGWGSERLKVEACRAVALDATGRREEAMAALEAVLGEAEAEGLVRLFLDEGRPMLSLLSAQAGRARGGGHVRNLLAAFDADLDRREEELAAMAKRHVSGLVEPLSPRELEVLRLVAEGLSNQGIAERLFLALDTVKGHNRRIFEKLGVKRRTEAIARSRDLGLL